MGGDICHGKNTVNSNINHGIAQLIASFMFFLVAWVGFVWMLASANLAAADCDFEFSLLREQFRCGQPYLSVILWVGSGIVCVWLFKRGITTLKKAENEPPTQKDN